jgi:hypothetical protein
MQDATARRHPLDIAGTNGAAVTRAVGMFHVAGQDIGNGLYATMRVPGKTLDIVRGIVRAEIVEEQEWIEKLRIAKADRAVQVDAGSFDGGPALKELANASILAHGRSLLWSV